MKAVVVSPRAGLIAAVLERLQPRGKDYSDAWIVFPEQRPGYHLRKALAAREGTGFVPPRVDSFDGFVDRVFEERLKRDAPLLDPLDAVKLLHGIHTGGGSGLGGGSFLNPDEFFSLGLKMYRDLEDLTEAGIAPESLRELDIVAGEGRERKIPPKSRGRLQSLSYFHEKFAAAIAAHGLSTPASRKAEVAAAMGAESFGPEEEIIFAGFFILTEMEKRILRAAAGRPRATFLFLDGPGIGTALAAIGAGPSAVVRPTADPGPPPDLVFVKSPDTHGQVFALNGWLESKMRIPGALDDRSVVVLPAAESLFPVYHQTLAALPEETFNISMGYPLSRTPLFTFFEHLFEVLRTRDDDGRVFGPRYLRFVLHPYTKNIYFRDRSGERPDVTRVLFHAVEEHFTRKRMKAFWPLGELEIDPDLWETVDDLADSLEDRPLGAALREHLRTIHDRTFGRFASIRDAADFARKANEVLEYVYANSSARQHPFFHPFAESFRRRFEALAGSRFGETAFEDPSSYFNLFRKIVAQGIVPFAGTPLRGLQVLGFWETRGIPFEDVALLDANEGILPSFERSDTLLPYAVRKTLGLPTTADLERRMAYHLDTLIRGARRVHVFYIENKDRERSRFVEKLVWDLQKTAGEKDSGRFVRALQYKVDLRIGDPVSVAKTPEIMPFLREFRYSASSLNSYLACPLKFYNAHVLGLRERESLEDSLDTKDIGSLVHAVLEELFRPFIGRTFTMVDLERAGLPAAIERLFEDRYGKEQRGGVYLLKHQVSRHLADFLSGYQAGVLQNLPSGRIKLLELEMERNVELQIGADIYKTTVRADRVEEREGIVYILDYKTGAGRTFQEIGFKKLAGAPVEDLLSRPRDFYGAAFKSVQIPFYILTFSQLLGIARESVEGKIVLLGMNGLNAESEFSPLEAKKGKDDPPRARKLEMMEAVIHGLLREINDPSKPFVAAEDSAVCAGCPFAVTCDRLS
jgi:CRISPR/Cas system-associated exonuclease Cas4 (RecB family)